MDAVYARAAFVAILLEDVELSKEEHDILHAVEDCLPRGASVLLRAELVRRILKARWFSRAWCSQEKILSRSSHLYLFPYEQGICTWHVARLRDMLYAIEAFDATEIWPTFRAMLATRRKDCEGAYGFRQSHTNDLWTDVRAYRQGLSLGYYEWSARACMFLEQNGSTCFSVISLIEQPDSVLIVGSNMAQLQGRTLFQPYVMRINELTSNRPTMGTMVLDDKALDSPGSRRASLGHVRSFHRIPEACGEVDFCRRCCVEEVSAPSHVFVGY